MCGIFGSVFLGPNSKIDILPALLAIKHRGPDLSHHVAGEDFIFGHTRLAILDLTAAAAQPMLSPSKEIIVVFNGEIYNHAALREELEKKEYGFRTRSDTEVILHGYHAWGEQVFERLDGMFAIGVFDKRSQELFLTRDRSGKKPLFYASQGRSLAFASEIKAILASGLLKAEFNAEAL